MKTTALSLLKIKLQIPSIIYLLLIMLIFLTIESNVVSAQIFSKVQSGEFNNPGKTGYGVGWIDFNNDGYIDILVTNCGGGPVSLYLNDKAGSFVLSNNPVINSLNGCYSGITWGDYDNDGDNDLFITMDDGSNILLDNLGDGNFQKNTKSLLNNAPGKHMHCTWVDYDNDGWLDMFIPTVATFNFAKGGGSLNHLYHNNGDGTFSKIINDELTRAEGNSECGNFADYDNDGDMDLFVTNWEKDNWLFENNGDGSFSSITGTEINTNTSISSTCCWGDYDNDGDMDLFVGNGSSNKVVNQKNFLFRNNGNKTFTKITTGDAVNIDVSTFTCMWGDVDNDGDLDLFIGQYGAPNTIFINDGAGNLSKTDCFDVPSEASSGAGFGDYDNDGFLDLFIANVAATGNTLYHNNKNNNNWINITCKGLISNRSAIGARVKVKANIFGKSYWQIREINGNQGFRSFSDIRAHFGLGDAAIIDSLVVIYPSGIEIAKTNVPVNQFMSVNEEIPVNFIKPVFTADTTKGKAKLTVHFTEKSIVDQNHPITSWSWDFDNNGIEDSKEQNPVYTFQNDTGRVYSVSLTVSNGITTKTIIKNDLIHLLPKESANLALLTKVVASSVQTGEYNPEYAVDGDIFTRWSSKYKDPQWIMIEMDSIYNIGKVILKWAGSYGLKYNIQTALDTSSWQTVFSETSGNGNTDEITFSPIQAKYIRMYGIKRGTAYGYSLYEFEVYKSTTTSINELEVHERNFGLYQNYPNPFNPETVISYQLPAASLVELKVFDMLGCEVTTLVNKEQDTGNYKIKFDGSNLPSGIYFCRLKAGNFSKTRKLMLLR